MQRLILSLLVFLSIASVAQNKKSSIGQAADLGSQPASWESDTLAYSDSALAAAKEAEYRLPREFMVYTKKPKKKTDRTKLCFNLVSRDTVLNYCMNDSICKDPEVSKILFESQKGDTTYVLIYVDAFSKIGDDYPQCNAGKETKLVFVRWNTKTNKAKWKQKTICSCVRHIVNMTKEPILNWDRSKVLVASYYISGTDFPEIKFDPSRPELGFQGSGDSESK